METISRILALLAKEFIMVLKDRKSRFVIIGPPLIQFFVFGYAATYDLKDVRYAVLDESRTPESREILSRVAGSETFRLSRTLASEQEMAEVIDREEARLLIHIGPRFAERIRSGEKTEIQVIADGRNPNVAMVALGYLGTIVAQYNEDLVKRGDAEVTGPGIVMVDRAWFNENLTSRWFVVSALGGLISMVVVIIMTSLSVAREREFGTFDQLLVAPFRPVEILIGKSIPGITVGLLDALLLAAASVWWFGVPFRGTVAALVLCLLVFIITIVGVGLLISSVSMTMQQGLLGAFVFMMPSAVLSGVMTPIENMPGWLQILDLLNPMRHVIIALRNIFLKGADVAMVWPQVWPLLLMAVVTLPLAAWMFRNRSQ